MKNVIKLVLVALLIVACKQNEPEIKTVESAKEVATESVKSTENPYKDYAKAEFEIKGMTCAMGCAKTIEKKLAKLEGVHFVHVNFEKELAMVEYDDSKLTNEDFLKTVANVSDTYKVGDINSVEVFAKDLEQKETTSNTCKKDCKKGCCVGKSKESKKTCTKDCKKACCVKEGQI